MGAITVRVKPGASRPGVENGASGVVIRVRSAPEAGRATQEARRMLAAALGVAPSRIRLRSGASSRVKLFEVDGLTAEEIAVRLGAMGTV